jgi:hypothetical protein
MHGCMMLSMTSPFLSLLPTSVSTCLNGIPFGNEREEGEIFAFQDISVGTFPMFALTLHPKANSCRCVQCYELEIPHSSLAKRSRDQHRRDQQNRSVQPVPC